MKRLLKVAVAAIGLAAAALATAQQIQVQIDGNHVYFPNAQAEYVNGRVLVPLRGVFEQMGANVSWDPYSQTVSARKEGTRVRLRIGDHTAMVNGSPVTIDVPPMIIDGSTMVPIRFVSEALGAQVGWYEAQQLVTITTATTSASVQTPPRRLHRFSLHNNEVIPLTLDQRLSTIDNRKGDTFSATVRTNGDSYQGLPAGTRVEGHIAAIHPMRADRPAILDLAFDRIVFPSGRSMSVDGTLISLDGRHVYTNGNGVIVARRSASAQDQRMVYAGYGAGAGLLVGVLSKRPLEDTILGGALGYIAGQVQHDQRQSMTEITLDPGTTMGVRLSHDTSADW